MHQNKINPKDEGIEEMYDNTELDHVYKVICDIFNDDPVNYFSTMSGIQVSNIK